LKNHSAGVVAGLNEGMGMNEIDFIEHLRRKISRSRAVSVGIGDDAAVLAPLRRGRLVVSTDMLVENVDFRIKKDGQRKAPDDFLTPEQIGRKALAVNLSDMAAMGAKPLAFVLTIGKPTYTSTKWLDRFYNGMMRFAKEYGVNCIGGDFSRAREFSVSVTILGVAEKPILRSGAKPGDWIGITGKLGGSIRRHHFDFTPRVKEGLLLSRHSLVRSMIDVSDGLFQDLQHILRASGVSAEVDLEAIPVSSDAIVLCHGDTVAALKRALTDGEDFELLLTVSSRQKAVLEPLWKRKFPSVGITWIGRIVKGRPEVQWFSKNKKIRIPNLSCVGYQHF